MRLFHPDIHAILDRLHSTAAPILLDNASRIVIFSDLHLGDGGRNDEFMHNAGLFEALLKHHYLQNGFGLVLNGDIEELFKFSWSSIGSAWQGIYELFFRFGQEERLWKIYGNHDIGILEEPNYLLAPWLSESLLFRSPWGEILLFHGHQASMFLSESWSVFSRVLFYLLRYVAGPVGIRNYSVSHKSRKRFAIERAVYDFSNRFGIISIIGHTHRPLFESLSKVDHLNYRIEELCRSYPMAGIDGRLWIESEIGILKDELETCYRKGFKKSLRSGRYGNITIPSIFNSGCAIGKRGITAIEIDRGTIRLVYWQQPASSRQSIPSEVVGAESNVPGGYKRVVLNEDRLDYVFSRIRLLSGGRGATDEAEAGMLPSLPSTVAI